jgi:iron complex outermembrane recepter protein
MNKASLLKKPLAYAVAIMASGVVAQAQEAQEAQPQRKGAAAALLEEVHVTARKRSAAEAVQDVPLAITAYGADQLDALFVKRLDDLSYSAPNVQLDAVGTFPGVQNFTIRGQGINSSIPSVDPTVGTFVDGVYLGVTYGVVVDVFELETIEILRGPQGLLFGRNVTGGAVVLRTARPNGEFDYRVRVQATDHDQYNIAGSIEGALIEDKLAAKLVVYHDNDDGYFDNETSGPTAGAVYFNAASRGNTGAMRTTLIRPTLVLQATEDLEFTLIAESGDSDGDGASWAEASAQRDGSLEEFTTTMDETGETDMSWDQVTFETNLNVDFGEGTITNILGWRQLDAFSIPDVDGTETAFFTVPGETNQDQISNELRYAGTLIDGALDLTTGIYYFQQNIKYREGRYIAGGARLLALGGDMDHETWGVFINNDYHLTDALTLTAGIRYTEEEKDAAVITGACPDVVSFNCTFQPLKDDWSNWTPKIGFNYHLNEDSQIYAFWTKGFRSGGVNFRNAKPDVIEPGPTKEEEQQSYEVGIKSQLMDGRLRLNGAYFYNIVDDMQRELNIGDADVVVLQGTVNAGDVIIQGVEVDFVALLTDSFAVNGSVGYLDGEYDSVNPLYAGFLGTDLPRLSPWTANLGVTYDMDLGNAGSLTFRGSYSFRDTAAYNDSNTEIFDQQHEATASADYMSNDEHWKVSLFGKNLNDEARWGNLTSIGGLWTAGPMQKGRVVGVEVEYAY